MDRAKPPGDPSGPAALTATEEVCVLLLVASDPDRSWPLEELAKRSGLSPDAVVLACEHLQAEGLLGSSRGGVRATSGADLRERLRARLERGDLDGLTVSRASRLAVERARVYVRLYEYLRLVEIRRDTSTPDV